MSVSRWFPLMRRVATSPTSQSLMHRPAAVPALRAWDDFSRLDAQMQIMERDMDRMFHFMNHQSMFPSFAVDDSHLLDSKILEKDGKKHMQMQFDLRQFKPEEIELKTKDGKTMEVLAKHEDSSDNGTIKRQYHRVFSLPENVDMKEVESALDPDGVLSITAPLKEVEEKPKEEKRSEDVKMNITHE